MKTIYKPNDTIVGDLDETIKILEKTNRYMLTNSIKQLRRDLVAFCNQKNECHSADGGIELIPVFEETNHFRAEVAKDILAAIVYEEGSFAHIKDRSVCQQVTDAIRYADELIKQLNA